MATARLGGDAHAGAFLRRWTHEITVSILRRRAAMARAVHMPPSARATWMLTGQTDGVPDAGHGLPPLDELDVMLGNEERVVPDDD
eukprot:556358-Karenia_brevis.AAC.1